MPKKLHVANLDIRTEDAQLEDLFARHGVVRRAQVMTHRALGSTAAVGLVEMDSDDASSTAMAMLNGQEYRGRVLAVGWATDIDDPIMFDSMNMADDGDDATARAFKQDHSEDGGES